MAEEGIKPNIKNQKGLLENEDGGQEEWVVNENSIVVVPGMRSDVKDFKAKLKMDFAKKIRVIDEIAFEMRETRTRALMKQASQ